MSMWSRHGIFTHPAWTPPPLCPPALQRPEGWKLHLSDSLAWGCSFQTYCHCSVSKLCPTLCYHMNCSTPGFPELHYLLEFAQTHVHWVNDAIQPFHPLSSPSPAFSLSQHQGLFQWLGIYIYIYTHTHTHTHTHVYVYTLSKTKELS